MYLHAFTHDLSKFRSSEFIPYSRYFHGDGDNKEEFQRAWEIHYKRNKHHPEHWIGQDMPIKHIKEMICDLKGMSRKFGGTAQEYYLKNYYKWDMTKETRRKLETQLDLTREYNAPICECSNEYWMTICELIEDMDKYYEVNGKISNGTPRECLNDLLKPACDKYNLDIYTLVKNSKRR